MNEPRYLTDEEIEQSYENFTIRETKFYSKTSGFLDIVFPQRESVCDNFIIYENGKIAFDNWYPERVYFALCTHIRNSFPKQYFHSHKRKKRGVI